MSPRLRAPRTMLALAFACAFAVVTTGGCGDGGNREAEFDADPLPDPPGSVLSAGAAGPALSVTAARLRLLRDLLRVAGVSEIDVQGVVTGVEHDPLDDLFELPGGPYPEGTIIGTADPQHIKVTLNDQYHIYWLDPLRTANLGHRSFIVYVRARDGQVILQETELPPLAAGGASLDEYNDRESALVYRHQIWAIHDAGPPDPLPVQSPAPLSDAGPLPSMHQSPHFGGLAVSGSTDGQFVHDLDEGGLIYRGMAGSGAGLKTAYDQKSNRMTVDRLAACLRMASTGLGKDDKFFFIFATHGFSNGSLRIGDDLIFNKELCQLILDNVSAGTINMVYGACFGGTFVCELEKWASMTDKKIRVIAATDKDHVAFANTGVGTYAIRCIREMLIKAFDAARAADGDLSLAEIEAIFAKLAISRADIEMKACAIIDKIHGVPLPQKIADYKSMDMLKPDVPGIPPDPNDEFDDGTPPIYCGGGAVMTGGINSDLSPPGSGGGGGVGTTPVEITIPTPTGSGTTNDGAGEFDLGGGSVSLGEPNTRIEISGPMQVINIPGHGAGSYTISGPLMRKEVDGTLVFDVSGSWRVFPEAQLETDIAGTVTISFAHPTLTVTFDGTHAAGQAANFVLTGALAAFGARGDFDGDNDVDIDDLADFQSCFGGTCPEGDLDLDGDVDQQDLFLFQNEFSGPR